ncbi:hypothetical protein J132_05318 [Termitomyces sp. J132]|nr:hypothetical protein J132_05318 [Termitomyces sp. J132]
MDDNVEHNAFPDEYDLSHEDPKILQDVQHALKLKSRREARLSNQATPPRSDSRQQAISSTMQYMPSISPNSGREALSSDIDFSPSTGTVLFHPVPASLDNGLTLDWSSFDDKPERKWKLTGTKRKGKETLLPSSGARGQQETEYADKLCRLKNIASPQTKKKAEITQDQLGRRYHLIFDILSTGKSPNIAKVARWYGQQDTSMRNALERAEPFTWLKHLEKRDRRPTDRSPWHISALIAEQYLRTVNRHDSMTTIPEESPGKSFHESPTTRVSLPSAPKAFKSSRARQQREADEYKAYSVKTRLLEQTITTNHRIRQLLNRISGDIREYDVVQSNAMASLGIAQLGLPRELIDAFGHDPAAVTGSTRRFQGWRAVDDIQHRLLRQREAFRAFLSRAQNQSPRSKSVLDDPISSLVQSLKALELHSQKITGRALEVGETLKTVQAMHDAVKTNYNKTLARTSVVYPELSRIVILEESYKDQYQQFWELGMDTLTFILDTVTPFWRTYGKTIGEDIRDFLIIPLYRNEFTGESKRYPVTRLPLRTLRHWLGLAIFFFASVAVAVLQVRAALSSSALYKLPMIPYESIRWTALPFFWLSILIQWWAVVIEFIIVFLQLGVVVWWTAWSVRIFT